MKKINVYVDGRRATANNEYPVYIRVYDDRTGRTMKFSTGITSPVVFTGRSFPSDVPNADILTTALNDIFRKVQQVVLFADVNMAENELRLAVEQALGRNTNRMGRVFTDYIKLFMETKTNPSTISLYDQTLKKVIEFDAVATFDTITPNWLTRYENHFRKTMTVNGLAISMRNIRSVFNWAITNEYTNKYPFRKYKIKRELTKKRSIPTSLLRKLRDWKCDKWLEEYRDMFMLQFYLIGINISDLLLLKKLEAGRCVYRRKKTGRLYDIAVPPEAMAIINKYKGKKYLLCPLDRYKTVGDYTCHMNKALKKIGPVTIVRDKLGMMRKLEYDPLVPNISTYWARHTWATIAASLDIPKETIGKALGHSEWDSTTTDIYIDFDSKKIDEANREVIDYVNSDLKNRIPGNIIAMSVGA